MNLREIEERVGAIEPRPGVEFLEDLLLAYGFKQMTVSRLMSGSTDKAETAFERLLKGKVYFHATDVEDDQLYRLIDAARKDPQVVKHAPRFLIVKNADRLLATDQHTGESLDIAVAELATRTDFFLPWAGIEKTALENINYADVKAAEKMAKLYDEVTKHNHIETEADIHDLNVFFSRLLFCFFAEDTGVFEEGSFTNTIGSYTQASGEDTNELLDQLFDVLDRDVDEREGVPGYLKGFGYVNGNLFARHSRAPRFSAKARTAVLECGTLDWSQINPDIFGSMIQAVVHPSQREGLGMHYTSVENIMKVIRPLFLDDLEEAFEKADTQKKLQPLLDRIADIQIFDPACGSGNFLVISYKELRKLEHRILQRLIELDPKGSGLFKTSSLKLENFYGIEIDDFAHEIAILSLWLAKHQMNVEFKELFGAEIPLIPLQDAGNITCGNAARLEWTDVCNPADGQATYVIGNPPYAGSRTQNAEQKADFKAYFGGDNYPRDLDYIALWFLAGARFLNAGSRTRLAFVSTNSVCQGEQIALMWPHVFDAGTQISFGHQSFRWSNQARGGAGVSCVVVGLCTRSDSPKNVLYRDGGRRTVTSISPYLSEGPAGLIVTPRRRHVSGLPAMAVGSKPVDGGHLVLTDPEVRDLLATDPGAEPFVRRYGGSQEAISGTWRACLWIPDESAETARRSPAIAPRLEKISALRAISASASTRSFADQPHRFIHRAHKDTSAILIPEVSSERRTYIPLEFVGPETVISNKAYAVYGGEPWLFALLHSRMHMVWVSAVGGRMKTDYSYSAGLVYNTFPTPPLGEDAQFVLDCAAMAVIAAREQFPDRTLAQLYDPDQMPPALCRAHDELDATADRLYRPEPFDSDDQRLTLLFERYEAQLKAEPAHA